MKREVLGLCLSWNQAAPPNDEEPRNQIHTTLEGQSWQCPTPSVLQFRIQVWPTTARKIRFRALAGKLRSGGEDSFVANLENSILQS